MPTDPTPAPPACAVAIGNFDGVHLGHLEVLATLFALARRLGVLSCVYTFDPAPTAVVAPERHQPRLQTLANRVAALRAAGVDQVVVQPFTADFAGWSAEQFIETELLGRLGARGLVVGHDFRFGRMRAGDAASIRELAPGLEVVEVGAFRLHDEPVSSSRVRKYVQTGAVVHAAVLLGRPFTVSGPVVHGDARGRTLGFPTANIALEEEIRPSPGVYAVRARLVDGRSVPGVANLGFRPTVAGSRYAVEAHLFDFAEDLYGQPIELALVAHLREERRFPSLETLVAQIREDAAAARRVLA